MPSTRPADPLPSFFSLLPLRQGNAGANLFSDYAMVADRMGVYTAIDYANVVDHLVSEQRPWA
jgi:hypothetical protein